MRESPFVRDHHRPRTAIVTGGAGFIGSAVVRRLRRDGVRVIVLDALTSAGNQATLEASLGANSVFIRGDITDAAMVAEVYRRYRPDAVFHLAAETHVDRVIDTPMRFVQANIVGTAVLLDEGLRHWRSLNAVRRDAFRFIHASTDEVFGALGSEGVFTPTSPHRPNSPYAASKSAADQLVRSWYQTFGFPVITTTSSNNFGPHQFPEKLMPLTIRRALRYDAVRVYGEGVQTRDWLYVDDHADGLVAAWDRGIPGQTYLFGSGEERQNLHVVGEICSVLDQFAPEEGRPARSRLIEHVADRPGHDFRYALDISITQNSLAWTPATSFEAGLRRTVGWYLGHQAWCETVLGGTEVGERLGLGEAA